MPTQELGKVTVPVPGTPVQATVNQTRPSERLAVNAYMAQCLPSNTGKVYVGNKTMNKTTLAGVTGILAVPTANTIPSFSVSASPVLIGFDMTFVYVDADVAGEGCIISCVVL